MKALQVTRPRTFTVIEIPKPQLASDRRDEILVQPVWFSMCGSDIPFFTGNKRHKTYPLPVGMPIHECYGQVIESTSHLFRPGDPVVAIPHGDQGLAELFVAQAIKAVRIPDELKNCDANPLIQPLATVLNAVDRLGNIQGKSIAVIGLGSIGQLFCWLLRKRGAGKVTGIDPLKERCQFAEKFGAVQTVQIRSLELAHFAHQKPGAWDAPDICIEAVGHQMDTLNDCLDLVRKYGTVVAFGVPDQPVYAIEYETFFRKNLDLLAVVTPNWNEYLAKACDLFVSNRNELSVLVTHQFPIREAEQAFSMYESHSDGILKALIRAGEW